MNDDRRPIPLLEVHESVSGEVSPSSADVHVVLTGERFFSGRAAFEKAEELRRLASSLEQLGIPSSALALEGVSLDVSSGIFSRSSSATYRVRIRLEDVELLAGALDAIAGAKKARLSHVDWVYDESSEEQRALLQRAGARATAKARALAEAVGATLARLHSVREERDEPTVAPSALAYGAPQQLAFKQRASVSEELAGLELAPKKRVTVRVMLAYEIA